MTIDVSRSRTSTWRRLLATRQVRWGLVLMLPPILVALLGPFAAPHDPLEFIGRPFVSDPGLLGTDGLGRDVLSRWLAGGSGILWSATVATLLGVVIGSLLGCLFAYLRGPADEVAGRLADVLMSFPPVVFALLVLTMLGSGPWLLVLVVAAGYVPRSMRVVRSAALSIVERDFIHYDQSVGMPATRVTFREVLPNCTGPIMAEMGIRFSYSLNLIAGLSFIGLGVHEPEANWGLMINENRIGLSLQPWGVLAPLISIALLAVGANLIADGIARVLGGQSETAE